MKGVTGMTTDQEFADYLKSMPREQSEAEVARHEAEHDLSRGAWVDLHRAHHEFGEAAH